MIRLGIIGTGGMAHHHAREFQKIKGVALTAACDIVPQKVKKFAVEFGIPAVYFDCRDMLAAEELDAVTTVTSDDAHAEVALAVIAKGLPLLSEKPLATNMADARKMATAARKAGVVNMVNFSYRNSSALHAAAKEIRHGRIGRVIHVESSYLQSWLVGRAWGNWRTSSGWLWRLSTKHKSAGVLGDIGCHIYDLTTLMAGDIASIDCRLKTFDKGVRRNRIGEYVLDANDSFVSNVQFAGGALGTVHATRWATGQINSLRCRVYGDEGAIEIDLDRSYGEYRLCQGRKAIDTATWKTVKCPPTPTNYQRFIRAVRTGKGDDNNFANGAKIQAYLAASFLSARKNGPVAVKF